MAFERSDQKFFIGGRSPSGMTNLLLFLICIGVIVIILLLLFCPRWGCWRGTKVLGPDGRTYDGGNVIINSACCDGGTPRTPGCPQCPPCDGQTCEEGCRQYSASPEKYKYCMERCNPPGTCTDRCEDIYQTCQQATTTATVSVNCAEKRRLCIQECNPPQTCEEGCRQYSNYPERYKTCMNQCNPPQTCEERCKQAAKSTTEYEACARQCNPPPQTCEESCRTKYANQPESIYRCVMQCSPSITCEEVCAIASIGNPSYFNTCVAKNCQKPTTTTTTPPDCRDSDGNNVNVVGVIVYGDEKHIDTCADSMRVNEWICRDGKPMQTVMTCAGRCLNGACTTAQTTTTPMTYVPRTLK